MGQSGLDRGRQVGLARIDLCRAEFQTGQPIEPVKAGEDPRRIAGDGGGVRAVFVRGRREELLLNDLGKSLNGICLLYTSPSPRD